MQNVDLNLSPYAAAYRFVRRAVLELLLVLVILLVVVKVLGVYPPQVAAADPSQSPAAAYGHITLEAGIATRIPTRGLTGRHGIVVVNLDSAKVWCGWDNLVDDTSGAPVKENGGSFSWEIGYNTPAQISLWCYSAAGMTGPNDLRWQEVR